MRRLLLLVLLVAPAFATTTVTGNIQTLGATPGPRSFVRFTLRGCGGNAPAVSGVALIAPSSGANYFIDFPSDASGNISGTLYATRDSAGTGGGEISCGGSTTSVWYGMTAFGDGKAGPEVAIHAKNGTTLDISSVTPITTNPVVTAPTGDTTYARLDSGNQPFLGNVTPNGNGTLSLGTSSNRWKLFATTADITSGSTTNFLPSTITGSAIIGEANVTLGTGSGRAYGVVGVAKGSSDSAGDIAYGGYFRSTASNNVGTEVGLHAETSGGGGSATIAEFYAGSSLQAKIDGAGIIAGNGLSISGDASFSTATFPERAAPSGTPLKTVCYADNSFHGLECSFNNDTFHPVTLTIAKGTSTLTGSAISSGSCATTVTTSATGTFTDDTISVSYASFSAPSTDGRLTLSYWPTTDHVNFALCNPTAGSITPSGLVVNWNVLR